MPLDHAISARLARPIRIRAVEAIPVGLPLSKRPLDVVGSYRQRMQTCGST